MPNSTQDRNTSFREHMEITLPVLAGQRIWKGTIIAVDVAGIAGMFSVAPTATRVVGVAYEQVDNTAGANGAKVVRVRQGCHKFAQNGTITTAVFAGNRHPNAVAVDNQTVAFGANGVSGTGTYCGQIVEVEADGVWVNFSPT